MSPPLSTRPRLLYAAILASDRNAARLARRSLDVVVEGPIGAVTGPAPRGLHDITDRALAHDQVMQRLLERCTAVLPFRLDTRAPAPMDLSRLLRDNGPAIEANLRRFQGRVEVGIKVKSKSGAPFAGRLDCSPIHALAGPMQNRRERIAVLGDGALFEGTYLIAKSAVDDFWSAVLKVREALNGFAVIGTGPWAPYSFCDLELPSYAGTNGMSAAR